MYNKILVLYNVCSLEHTLTRMISSIGKNEMQAGLVSILAKLAIAQGALPGGGDASNARASSLFTSLLTDSDDMNKLLVLTLLRALYVSGTPL